VRSRGAIAPGNPRFLEHPPIPTRCDAARGGYTVELGGIDQMGKVAPARLRHSLNFFLAAYARESREMLLLSTGPGK
jgi:hypothetical protein